jgi:hypothetical protein
VDISRSVRTGKGVLCRFWAGCGHPVTFWSVAHLPLSQHKTLQRLPVRRGMRFVALNLSSQFWQHFVHPKVTDDGVTLGAFENDGRIS